MNPHKVGNSTYHPNSMLKLLLYGYSYGVRNYRKLVQETPNNLTSIWLMGGLKPDFKTIAEFRRTLKKSLTNYNIFVVFNFLHRISNIRVEQTPLWL